MLKGALQWLVYPQRTGSIYRRLWQPLQSGPWICMLVLMHFTDPGRMESWVNFSGKEGDPNIQPSNRPGFELGTSELGGRDLNHCANPIYTSHIACKNLRSKREMQEGYWGGGKGRSPPLPLPFFFSLPLSPSLLRLLRAGYVCSHLKTLPFHN